MPCEIVVNAYGSSTLCPHPAIAECADCGIGLCSAHIVECDVCELLLCKDCIPDHIYKHDLAEKKLKAGA
jgi:hypothetical protein